MTLSDRVFRALMRAYPRDFRKRFAGDMTELFRARLARARSRGRGSVAWFWFRLVCDTAVAATLERAERLGRTIGETLPGPGLGLDLRSAIKRLSRTPGASVVTVGLVALGIAGNVVLFSVVDILLIQDPPGIGEADRAVEVMGHVPSLGSTSLSYPEFAALRDEVDALGSVAVWEIEPMAVLREGAGRRMLGMYVSAEYFDAMRAQPVLGRAFTFTEAEGVGAEGLVVVSDRMWRQELGGGSDAIGRTLLVNRVPHTVIGVASADFRGHLGPVGVDLWVPLATHPMFDGYRERWSSSWVEGIGRLADGASIEEAQASASAVFARAREGRADVTEGKTLRVNPIGSVPADGRGVVGAFLGLLMLFGVLGLSVLCANIGGMVLARGVAREREIAVRLALGAGRGRVVRQFLTESALLGTLGGATGLWLAFVGLRTVERIVPSLLPVPVTIDVHVGPAVFAFAALVAAVSVVVTGLLPALKLVREGVVEGLKGDGNRGLSSSTGMLGKVLLRGQVAASTLLLILAGLFLRALVSADANPPGFEADGVYARALNLEAEGLLEAERALPVLDRMTEAISQLAEVQSVSVASDLPMDLGRTTTGVLPEGADSDGGWMSVDQAYVGPEYFETLGIPVEAGRGFTLSDARDAPKVVVVSRELARLTWPDESALGRRLRYSIDDARPDWHTVVGVVGDVLNETATDPIRPMAYGAFAQNFRGDVEVVVRVAGSGQSLAPRMEAALRSVDPRLSSSPIRPMTAVASLGVLPQRIATAVAGVFGLLTVVLVGVGLYGTIAFDVGRRTREIGVRMALGADKRRLVGRVLRDTLWLTAPGFAIGGFAAYGIGRVADAFLLGVSSADPLAFGAVGLLILAVVLFAAFDPAWRASRVDPAEALRHE